MTSAYAMHEIKKTVKKRKTPPVLKNIDITTKSSNLHVVKIPVDNSIMTIKTVMENIQEIAQYIAEWEKENE